MLGIIDKPLILLKEEAGEITIKIEVAYRKDLLKFFLEMCTNWLIPGNDLFISKFNAVRENQLIRCEIVIIPRSIEEVEQICENFTLLEDEIKLGIKSAYHAKQLLELKGLSLEEKEGFVREAVRERVIKFPNSFDYDIFPLMQKFLVSSDEEYKRGRSYQVLSRIISTYYRVSQKLLDGVEEFSDKRHFILKLMPISLATPFGEKLILGCFIGMNFLKDNEILEERHLLRAVRKYCPDVTLVEGSYFIQKEEKTLIFYIELEQEESFAYQEITLLKKELKEQVKGSIESLVCPVFMPRNEEEVMKYIVTLSAQVTEVKDLPQIVIMFNEQTDENLIFTLVMVRPLFEMSPQIQKIVESDDFEVHIEKVRPAGYIRKRVSKEASQIRICMRKIDYLREDFVVDLYMARQAIVFWLERYLGPVRDYNGGMISRQMEIFLDFQEKVRGNGSLHSHRLSNFFHALYPIELRTAVSVHCLQEFYKLFSKVIEEDKDYLMREDGHILFICMKEKKGVLDTILALKFPSFKLLQLQLTIHEKPILGFLFFSESTDEKNIFLHSISRCLS